ncbi:MAG: hypothetical protein DME26_11435 [Verrucomicrobia bacterium]|nr:MAG: hypothetical protein DME26_11435 [Verrucomicrobiota bacterium]
MITRAILWPTRWVWLLVLLSLVSLAVPNLFAGDIKVELQLVWGTNEEKSPDPKYKPVDPAVVKRLASLKWKRYFQVNSQVVTIPSRKMQRVKLSPQCEVEITEMEGPQVEVKVYGRTAQAAAKNEPFKWVHKHLEKLAKDDLLVIAGDDKNDCAWAIVIKRL